MLAFVEPGAQASDAGRDWGVERTTYSDPVTGIRIHELTTGTNAADNLYFHFSNFTADNRYVLFIRKPRRRHPAVHAPKPNRAASLNCTDSTRRSMLGSACPDPRDARRVYLLRGAEVLGLRLEYIRAPRGIGRDSRTASSAGSCSSTVSHDGQWLAIGKTAGRRELGGRAA
ncbi:MAG: hypothetical protein V9G14_05610 [Cypionkella sp.]